MTNRDLGTAKSSGIGAILCGLLLYAVPWVAQAAEIAADVHLGVASCASSVCHGKRSVQENENVWLNEFRIWSTEDRHHRAYQTLLNDASKRMARNLGLPNAHEAKICLDCHADNVPMDKRGPKFQISDGVGCEACHGGGERWIESHTEPGVTHQQNLDRGMFPTETPSERARICLKCHMGDEDQFTTHRIMGAGHPRLTFELEAFTANQPAHYEVDADYIERKRSIVGFGLWITGQIVAAQNYLDLLQSKRLRGGIAPEFSLYDCHSCHHEMQDQRWGGQRLSQGLEPGGLRLQDYHLLMIRAVAQVSGQSTARELARLTGRLLRAGQTSYAAIDSASQELSNWLAARQDQWLSRDFSNDEVGSIRRAIAKQCADGLMSDFSAAEQAFQGIESLSLYIGDFDAKVEALDSLFEAVESEQTFSPSRFQSICRNVSARF